MSSSYFQGPPGITAAVIANFKAVFTRCFEQFLAQGRYIDGTKSRDPSNTTDVGVLQPGLVMGKITSGGLYAPSFYGLTTGALTSAGTTVASSAAIATELVRRKGATGTFKLTGPPTAAGTVRTLTATYSAVNTSTGDITITALGVNEVQTITFGASATGGSMRLRVPKANGEMVLTDAITWNGTDATWLSNINTALDGATGVVGGIVATGAAPDDALTLTFSGTGYAALPQPTEMVSVETLPTSVTTVTVARTTTGVDGRFVTASLIQPVDGSETPLSLIHDGTAGIKVTDDAGASVSQVDFAMFPIGGEIDCAQIINYPSDTSLRTWLQQQLSNGSGGKFTYAGSGGVY